MMCSVCLENFTQTQDVVIFRCAHIFHYECVLGKCGLMVRRCPYCRGTIPRFPLNPSDDEQFEEDENSSSRSNTNMDHVLRNLIPIVIGPRGIKRKYSELQNDNVFYRPHKKRRFIQ